MRPSKTIRKHNRAFALVEVLIAVTILSLVLLGVISGVSSSIQVMSGSSYSTRAMYIAQSRMNEFILRNMRGTDLKRKEVREYPGFSFSRITKRYEHPMLGQFPAYRTQIVVHWKEHGEEREYSIAYIYQGR